MHDQREVYRHRVEAFINQPLGQIERREAFCKPSIAEQRLVHARPRRAERCIQHVLQAAQHVVGIEHGVARNLPQPVCTVAKDIGERAGKHAHLAMKRAHPPERVWVPFIGGLFLDQRELAIGMEFGERQRSKRTQRLGQHHRPRTWPAAAVRG